MSEEYKKIKGGARFVAKVELKQPIVQEISDNIKDAQSVVLVDYLGLTVAEDTQLRRQLREAGVTYKVYKNTLMNFAFKGTDFESLAPMLDGPNAIAISTTDATAPARVLGKYASEMEDKFNLKAGMVDGEIYDEKGVIALSKIPSKDVLLAQLVGSLQGPIQGLAAILKAVADSKSEEAA